MKTILIMIFVLTANIVFAQRTVSGTVTDKNNSPIEGVIVGVQNTDIKVNTDNTGKYSIEVPQDKTTLEFTKTDFQTQTIEITGDVMNLTLNPITEENMFDISLEDLMNIDVTTASNKAEKLSEAPATTIVITKQEIETRGYTNVMEVLDDLPAIDLSTPYGDTYFKDYWRGYRNTVGMPYILMIDGVVFNSLYFNNTSVLTAIPLSNVEQIEVVFGPASSVYGANAFMGVINIITKHDIEGTSEVTGHVTSSTNGFSIVDFTAMHKINNLRFSLTSKFESGNLNKLIDNNEYYWTKDEFLTDHKIWGDFIYNNKLAGKFSSPINHKAVDFRMFTPNLEFGAQYFEHYTGTGIQYSFDKIPPQSLWIMPNYSVYGRYNQTFDKLKSTTMIRYFQTDVSTESQDIEETSFENKDNIPHTYPGNITLNPGEKARAITMYYWQTLNSSWSFTQDFGYDVTEKLTLSIGMKLEDKNLQRAYDMYGGNKYFADSLNDVSQVIPQVGPAAYLSNNRINWIAKAGYFQTKYRIIKNGILNLGARIDDNSTYGSTATFRAGYVQSFDKIAFKLLYGESYQEPTPRSLYGGWAGAGADPDLKPEKSRTYEINTSYTNKSVFNMLSAYLIKNTNTIVGTKNIGERTIIGLDYMAKAKFNLFKTTDIWASYTTILKQEEAKFDDQGVKTMGEIGDLSPHKVHFGASSYFTDNLVLDLRGRFRSKTNLVDTNPLGEMDSYFVLDGNITYHNILVKGLSAGIKVTNIFDAVYYQPGVNEAEAGTSPAAGWTGYTYSGSQGWYNSLLLQPHRMIWMTLSFNFSVK